MLEAKYEQVKLAAEADLETFIRLIHPWSVIGSIHCQLCQWLYRPGHKERQLILLPRGHRKSYIAACDAAWNITRNPATTILYISATANLATKQLKLIKDILTSDIYRLFWPEMVNIDEAKRTKWSETEISVDHPKRRQEGVRDPTVFTAGLTSVVTGLHCDKSYFDDLVIMENAYLEDARQKVAQQASLLSSVENPGATRSVYGTRYDPNDLYANMISTKVPIYNDAGNIVDNEDLYEVFERAVEDRGDGTGQFLWPKQQRYDGQWFGFDREILALKKANYFDLTQFYAQYYNNPNTGDNLGISRDCFQYYSKDFLRKEGMNWYYKDNKLNLFAAIDFAYSKKKRSDYSAVVVVGVDYLNNIYVLDIDRFKTELISEYYAHLLQMHTKWGFYKVKAECTAAQKVIVNDLKVNYIRPNGLALVVEDFNPQSYPGAKEERISALLEPRYANRQMWHYLGGNCQTLEEELVLRKPPHDDVKDCLATAVSAVVAPIDIRMHNYNRYPLSGITHHRFGGIA